MTDAAAAAEAAVLVTGAGTVDSRSDDGHRECAWEPCLTRTRSGVWGAATLCILPPSISPQAGQGEEGRIEEKGICTVLVSARSHSVTHRHPKNGDSMRGHPDR
eukprot:scaffold4455_cov132-Isochrysis_galbana.AAC.2